MPTKHIGELSDEGLIEWLRTIADELTLRQQMRNARAEKALIDKHPEELCDECGGRAHAPWCMWYV